MAALVGGGVYMMRRSAFPQQMQIGAAPAEEVKPAVDTPIAAGGPDAAAAPEVPGAQPAAAANAPAATTAGSPATAKPAGRAALPTDGSLAPGAAVVPGGRGARGAVPPPVAGEVPDAPPSPPPPPEPPPAPANAPVSFNDIKLLVKNGDRTREQTGVLSLADGHLTVLDRVGGTALVSLPYSALTGAAYSRSKQPKWKDAEGKDVEAKVDLGKLGFLRSERNWVILFSHGEPTFIRIEDSSLRAVLPAIESHAGVKLRR